MNKALVWIPVAFVLGGMIGFVSPNEELQALKKRPSEEVAKTGPAKPANGFGSFAQLVNIPDAANMKRRRARKEKPAVTAAVVAETNAVPDNVENDMPPESASEPQELNPEDLRLRLEEAADLWRTRAEMAKAKAVENLGLDAAGETRFNEAVSAMNEKLRDSMQAIADLLADEESMTPELGFRLMGDLSTTLAESYDAVGAATTPERRGEVSNLQMIDFVDPMVAEPLIAVQGKLGGGPLRLPGGHRR